MGIACTGIADAGAKEPEKTDALLTAFCLNSNNLRLELKINIVIPKGTTQCLKRHK